MIAIRQETQTKTVSMNEWRSMMRTVRTAGRLFGTAARYEKRAPQARAGGQEAVALNGAELRMPPEQPSPRAEARLELQKLVSDGIEPLLDRGRPFLPDEARYFLRGWKG